MRLVYWTTGFEGPLVLRFRSQRNENVEYLGKFLGDPFFLSTREVLGFHSPPSLGQGPRTQLWVEHDFSSRTRPRCGRWTRESGVWVHNESMRGKKEGPLSPGRPGGPVGPGGPGAPVFPLFPLFPFTTDEVQNVQDLPTFRLRVISSSTKQGLVRTL